MMYYYYDILYKLKSLKNINTQLLIFLKHTNN